MTNTMIERVAKAIYEASQNTFHSADDVRVPWEECGPMDRVSTVIEARAAIEAMREPTESMLEQGPPSPYMDKDVWAKMIDAALSQNPSAT